MKWLLGHADARDGKMFKNELWQSEVSLPAVSSWNESKELLGCSPVQIGH